MYLLTLDAIYDKTILVQVKNNLQKNQNLKHLIEQQFHE